MCFLILYIKKKKLYSISYHYLLPFLSRASGHQRRQSWRSECWSRTEVEGMALEGKKYRALMVVASYDNWLSKCFLGYYPGCESLPGQCKDTPIFQPFNL